jgi:hypothetical protein
MRAVASLLIAVVIVALVFQAGPRQAFACSCAQLPSNRAEARQRLTQSDACNAVTLVGVVEKTRDSEIEPAAVLRTERVFRGQIPGRFEVTSSNCNGIVVPFREGRRMVLEVTERDGRWEGHGCAAGIVNGVATNTFQDGDAWLSGLGGIGTVPPSGNHGSGLPFTVVALIAVSVATVTLAGVYVAQRRAGRGV